MRKFLVLLLVSCAVLTDAQVLTLQHSYEGTGFFYNSINRQTKESLMYEDNVDELYGTIPNYLAMKIVHLQLLPTTRIILSNL